MNIAIVDGYSTGAALARRLHGLGVQCTHVQSQVHGNSYLRRSFDPAHYADDLGFIPDPGHLQDLLERRGVSRVVAGSESGVTQAETLSLSLGLPTNTAEHREARRDKDLMAQAVRAAGLATPHGTVAASPDAAAAWFTRSGLQEAVVKPLNSAGTDGVSFCRTAEHVRTATAAVLGGLTIFGHPNTAVLLQERIIGTEYYINTVSHRGHHRVAEIWRYTKQLGSGGSPIYDYEEPVPADTDEARLLRAFTFAVLDALGIRESAAHTEVMLTRHGPVLIETGARLGGATDSDVVARYCGVSQTMLAATALTAPEEFLAFDERGITWSGAIRNVEFVNHHRGPADAAAIMQIAGLPSAVALFPAVDPGHILQPTTDLLSSPGYAYLAANSPKDIERDYALLRTWERAGLHTGGRTLTTASASGH